VQGKKAIVFCTYYWMGNKRTNNALQKLLCAKGYETVIGISKKMKPNREADFTDVLAEIKKTMQTLK
jgi:hypothetical protein